MDFIGVTVQVNLARPQGFETQTQILRDKPLGS